jgi:hypothetical protein
VALDRNLLPIKPEELKDIKVMNLYLQGRSYGSSLHHPTDLCMQALTNLVLKSN